MSKHRILNEAIKLLDENIEEYSCNAIATALGTKDLNCELVQQYREFLGYPLDNPFGVFVLDNELCNKESRKQLIRNFMEEIDDQKKLN